MMIKKHFLYIIHSVLNIVLKIPNEVLQAHSTGKIKLNFEYFF